jgi:hypothetical protein
MQKHSDGVKGTVELQVNLLAMGLIVTASWYEKEGLQTWNNYKLTHW